MKRAIPRTALLAAALLAAASFAASPARAQDERVRSLGQPWRYKPYLGGSFALNGKGDANGGIGVLGLHKDLLFPPAGVIGLDLEGYLGGAGDRVDGGGRLMARSRLLFIGLGVDYNARLDDADFVLSFNPYFKRGGLFRTGGNFRVDWIPGRKSVNVGYTIPLEPHMGKTRPVRIKAALPPVPKAEPSPVALPAEARVAIDRMRHAAHFLITYNHAFADGGARTLEMALDVYRSQLTLVKEGFDARDERHAQGHTYAVEKAHYDQDLDDALEAVAGPGSGRSLGDLFREVALDEVILPYDRLIGRYDEPDSILGLAARARTRLASRLAAGGFEPKKTEILAVFDQWAGMVEDERKRIERHWEGDERKAWLPLELCLRPEQHDSQSEIDALIARALGRGFEPGHAIFPTNAARFPLELIRSIRAARDYHVLWVHDYAGLADGKPDPIALRTTVEGYLRALTDRVREFDRTGALPTYLVFHTQWFYEGNGNRLYLTLLEDPLGHALELGPGEEEKTAEVRRAQDELRQAVAASSRLQALRKERGEKWLRGLVKVHVNVTYPADLSFRSANLLPFLRFTPDTLMFDHRKLFFYDVTEADPRKGAAAFSGTGVGLVYASPTWEDRGVLVTGPALVELKTSARQVLLDHGLRPEQIPSVLRPVAKPAGYDALVAELEAKGHRGRGLNVHNQVGFAPKNATLLQSMLYTLVPRDTVVVSPDSIWTNPYWAGQLLGAALRGAHVYIVAPSSDNAAAPSSLVQARTSELFARLLEARAILGDQIAAAGGTLRVGLYTREAPSGDTLAKIREVRVGLQKYPFLIDDFPFPSAVLELLEQQATALEKGGYKPRALAIGGREGKPKMHRKTQLFVSRTALRAIAGDPATIESLRHQLDAVAEVTSSPTSVLDEDTSALFDAVNAIRDRMRDDPPEAARDALYYLTVGSKNQDPRSAFLDGETLFAVSGPSALWSYPDFMFMMAATTWLDTPDQLAKLIPLSGDKSRKLGRAVRRVI